MRVCELNKYECDEAIIEEFDNNVVNQSRNFYN